MWQKSGQFVAVVSEVGGGGYREKVTPGKDSAVITFTDKPAEAGARVKPVYVGSSQSEARKEDCVCKKYDLIWGAKVSCGFRKKVVEICKDLWGEDNKIKMANGLMAVMYVESGLKAHQIMGEPLKNVKSITKDDFWLIKKDMSGKIISRSSRAVGLIQFTQSALEQIGVFTNGSGFDKLHEVKLKFAQMGEIKQLDYVKKYFEPSKNKIITPEDIYLHVFAPEGVGENDDYVLYETNEGEKYKQNQSVDNDNNGKITKLEILKRYKVSYATGTLNKEREFICLNDISEQDKIKTSKIVFFDANLSEYRRKVVNQITISLL